MTFSVRDRNRADRKRVQFSVLCWRGWCDWEFKVRDIPAMISEVSGVRSEPAYQLPRSECPSPGSCQCVCHDDPPFIGGMSGRELRVRDQNDE